MDTVFDEVIRCDRQFAVVLAAMRAQLNLNPGKDAVCGLAKDSVCGCIQHSRGPFDELISELVCQDSLRGHSRPALAPDRIVAITCRWPSSFSNPQAWAASRRRLTTS